MKQYVRKWVALLILSSFLIFKMTYRAESMSRADFLLLTDWTQLPALNNEIRSHINPFKYEFIVQSSPCTSEVQLLIVIHTSNKLKYRKRRYMLRSTWLDPANLEDKLGLKVKVVFFMGLSNQITHQLYLRYESELYGDIVQLDFSDTYNHKTYKAMSFLLWTSKYCPNATLLMKVDDDTLLQTERLPLLRSRIEKWTANKSRPLYIGKYLGNIPKRNPRSKWFISWEAWPEKLLPMWFQGLVYFMSPRHTGLVYEAALTTHYIQTDDVFMGISVSKVPDFNSGVIIDDKISAQNGDSYKKVLVLRNGWINSSVLFFHVPIDSLFMKWSSELHNT